MSPDTGFPLYVVLGGKSITPSIYRCFISVGCVILAFGFAMRPNFADDLAIQISDFANSYCVDCHEGDSPEGDFLVSSLSENWDETAVTRLWEDVLLHVERGIMPPPDAEQPPSEVREQAVSWIKNQLSSNATYGVTGFRRLSRREYQNSIRRIFDFPQFEVSSRFPPDLESDGFDNLAAALVVAPSHLEGLVASANSVADAIFPQQSQLVASSRTSIPPQDLVISYSSAFLTDDAMRLASSGLNERRHATWPSKFVAPATGTYKVSMRIGATPQSDGEMPRLWVGTMQPNGRQNVREFKSFEIVPSEEAKQRNTIEFELRIAEGETPVFRYENGPLDYDDKQEFQSQLRQIFAEAPKLAAAWKKVGDPARGGSGWEQVKRALEAIETADLPEDEIQKLADKYGRNSVKTGETLVYKYFEQGPFISIFDINVEGPYNPEPKAIYQEAEILADKFLSGTSQASPESTSKTLTRFLTKAFRRLPSQAEVETYKRIVSDEATKTGRLQNGYHLAIRTALISPEFLFRHETLEPDGTLSQAALASRIAYFLTSNPPDQLLVDAAARGELSTASQLRPHVERLLAKGSNLGDFANDFTEGWLGLSALSSLMPDSRLISTNIFENSLRSVMSAEPSETFQTVLAENLSALDLVVSDFVLTNPDVAWHLYGLEEFNPKKKKKQKKALQRIEVDKFGVRGGLLSMPAVMMATANGVDTQPVLRGVWVLENILGRPSPEPPDAVPALTPETGNASTPKERLAAHMNNESCSVCHREIDPLGFVLENYDPIGRFRESYPDFRSNKAKRGKKNQGMPVDATGVLPDGTKITDIRDLKRWLAADPKPFVQCLSEKLMVYALGRRLNYREKTEVAAIVDAHESTGFKLKDLIVDLVSSQLFKS